MCAFFATWKIVTLPFRARVCVVGKCSDVENKKRQQKNRKRNDNDVIFCSKREKSMWLSQPHTILFLLCSDSWKQRSASQYVLRDNIFLKPLIFVMELVITANIEFVWNKTFLWAFLRTNHNRRKRPTTSHIQEWRGISSVHSSGAILSEKSIGWGVKVAQKRASKVMTVKCVEFYWGKRIGYEIVWLLSIGFVIFHFSKVRCSPVILSSGSGYVFNCRAFQQHDCKHIPGNYSAIIQCEL